MPETIKMLKDLWEDNNKTPRPHLDETKIEEMERPLFEKHGHQNTIRNYHMDKRFFYLTRWICNENRSFKEKYSNSG
jgi:hypothetical protein